MEEKFQSTFNCGLRLTNEYLEDDDDEEDDEEVVIFDLPKYYPRHPLLRDNNTPESSVSYDSDAASDRSTTPVCCNINLSCNSSNEKPSKRSARHSSGGNRGVKLQQEELAAIEPRFSLVTMEKEEKEYSNGDESISSQEKDIDTICCATSRMTTSTLGEKDIDTKGEMSTSQEAAELQNNPCNLAEEINACENDPIDRNSMQGKNDIDCDNSHLNDVKEDNDLNNTKDDGSEKNSKEQSIDDNLDQQKDGSGERENKTTDNVGIDEEDMIKVDMCEPVYSKPYKHSSDMDNEMSQNSNKQVPIRVKTVGNSSSMSSVESERQIAEVSVPVATNPKGNSARKKTVYSFVEIIAALEEKVQLLLTRENYTCVDGRIELKFVRKMTRYSPDVVLNRRIVDKIIKLGIAHVFVRVWKSVNSVDFMNYDKYSCAFKNLQTALSIIWNCTDKSSQLCESLIKTHVLHDLIAELGSEKLSGSDLRNENNLYLVKAYLGILHNIVRLCTDSRRTFRSANSVKILQWYLNSSNDLIKTKSYLILSYIINEEENEIINAKDDNIQFIIDILKEALDSENHFSKTYAFWALEIVCGLNHLAVNESNKVRIGMCGALPLYIHLLQQGREEEQVLASAGLWILSFKDENKMLLRDDPSSIEILQQASISGASENIRRAARGALWVIKAAPDKLLAEPDHSDLPHVMVSYHHKSAQRMMIKVTRRLRQANYKVWMDLDDMHGSTLEAMALAIEKSCVILVCMTQGYKDSPSCRTEAEYTYVQKKEIIPLLLQEKYQPDGWLGAFVGARLHFDFSIEDKLAGEIQKLIHELGTRGRKPRRHTRSTSPASTRSMVSPFEAASLMSSFSGSSLHSYTTCRLVSVTTWNAEDIRGWLQSNMLDHIKDRFQNFNGELLLQLKKMMTSAPEYFYRTLEVQLKLDLVTSLKVARILEDVT